MGKKKFITQPHQIYEFENGCRALLDITRISDDYHGKQFINRKEEQRNVSERQILDEYILEHARLFKGGIGSTATLRGSGFVVCIKGDLNKVKSPFELTEVSSPFITSDLKKAFATEEYVEDGLYNQTSVAPINGIIRLYNFLNMVEYFVNQMPTAKVDKNLVITTSEDGLRITGRYEVNSQLGTGLYGIAFDREFMFPKCSEDDIKFIEKMINDSVPVFMMPLIFTMRFLNNNEVTQLFSKIVFRTPKGKVREVWNPLEEIKVTQRIAMKHLDIIYRFGNRYKNIKRQFAYIKGCNTEQAMVIHKDNKFFMKTDIKQFFDNIEWDIIIKKVPYFKAMIMNQTGHYSTNDYTYLDIIKPSIINSETGGVYLGAPLSGVITNFYMRNSVVHMERALNLAIKNSIEAGDSKFPLDMKYIVTIYADDIIVSCNHKLHRDFTKGVIATVLSDLSPKLTLHPKKTYFISNNKRRALGIGINHKNEMIKPRKYIRKITQYGFRPLMEKIAHKKVDISVLTRPIVGKINEALRYEDAETGSLYRYISKFEGLDLLLKGKGVNI